MKLTTAYIRPSIRRVVCTWVGHGCPRMLYLIFDTRWQKKKRDTPIWILHELRWGDEMDFTFFYYNAMTSWNPRTFWNGASASRWFPNESNEFMEKNMNLWCGNVLEEIPSRNVIYFTWQKGRNHFYLFTNKSLCLIVHRQSLFYESTQFLVPSYRSEQRIIGRAKIWWIRRLVKDFPNRFWWALSSTRIILSFME